MGVGSRQPRSYTKGLVRSPRHALNPPRSLASRVVLMEPHPLRLTAVTMQRSFASGPSLLHRAGVREQDGLVEVYPHGGRTARLPLGRGSSLCNESGHLLRKQNGGYRPRSRWGLGISRIPNPDLWQSTVVKELLLFNHLHSTASRPSGLGGGFKRTDRARARKAQLQASVKENAERRASWCAWP